MNPRWSCGLLALCALGCVDPGEGGDTDLEVENADRYCGERRFERRMDVGGDGYAPAQIVEHSACFRYQELDDDRVYFFHRIPRTDGPAGDGYCRMEGVRNGTFQAEITSGSCHWMSSTTQYRFDVIGGEVDVPGDGSVVAIIEGEAMDLIGDQVIYLEEAYFIFGGTDTTPADASLFPGDEDNLLEPAVCERDGCWEGTLEGSVYGGEDCQWLSEMFAEDTVIRLEVTEDGSTIIHENGSELTAFPDIQSCTTYGTTGPFPGNQWRYAMSPRQEDDGLDMSFHQLIQVTGTNGVVSCESFWGGNVVVLSMILALLGCVGDEGPPDPVEGFETETVYVDCFGGYDVKWISPTGEPGLAIARLGRTSDTLVGAFVRDLSRWDRAPVYFESAPLPVSDRILVEGTIPDPVPTGWWLIGPDGDAERVSFAADTTGRLPVGSVSYTAADGLMVGLTLEGWARYSEDGGVTWTSNLHSFTEEEGTAQGIEPSLFDEIYLGGGLLLYSTDGGMSYETFDAQVSVVDPELFGTSGIAFVDNQTATLYVSNDHGQSWLEVESVGNFLMPGTGEGELWVLDREGSAGEQGGLIHTTDGGETWRTVELVAGDEYLEVDRPWSTFEDEDGNQVLILGIVDEDGVHDGTRVCTVGNAPGSMRKSRVPARDDTPGSMTFWTPTGIPMPEPGQTSELLPAFYPPQHGFIDNILDVERTSEGNVLLLLAPDNLSVNSPYEVWEFDGTDGQSVVKKTGFDNLRDGNSVKLLETFDVQWLPDGSLRAQDLDGSGNYPFGGEDGVPLWGTAGIWGPTPQGLEYVATGAPFGWSGVFERVTLGDGSRCDLDAPTEDCIHWRTGDPWVDYILYDRWLYTIDGRHGQVIRHDLDGTVGDWEVVVEGLINPTGLYFTWDLDDPGLYVQDNGWWRFVPGDQPLRRP